MVFISAMGLVERMRERDRAREGEKNDKASAINEQDKHEICMFEEP